MVSDTYFHLGLIMLMSFHNLADFEGVYLLQVSKIL